MAVGIALILLVVLAGVVHGGTSGGSVDRVTVQAGDTVWSIAADHSSGGDVRAEVDRILEMNHLEDPVVMPGQVLAVPPG